jgi:hypothetical protein
MNNFLKYPVFGDCLGRKWVLDLYFENKYLILSVYKWLVLALSKKLWARMKSLCVKEKIVLLKKEN